jgi:Flp pilus assembly protein TadG
MIRYCVDRLHHAIGDRRGNAAIMFALALPVVIGAAGLAVDYAIMANQRTKMQSVADAAALSAARELRLAPNGTNNVAATAQSYAQSALAQTIPGLNPVIGASVIDNNTAVEVTITASYRPVLFRVISQDVANLSVTAVARSAGYPICALALDDSAPGTIHLEANALLTAADCGVYSDSNSTQGLRAVQNAVLTAGMICSAGGKVGSKANFTPAPLTDCPVIPDPLASRAPPPVAGCKVMGQVIDGETVTLMPGTYCDGLKITGAANVTLSPGIYVIKDGPLVVDNGSTLQAKNAGIYLTGTNTTLLFATDTTISLTAPIDGPLAGILLFEDRAAPRLRQQKILSDNAPVLLGTIYLPQGRLIIDAHKPIAQQSAYTIIVARRIELYSGPNLVLNSNYGITDVPAPKGVGPGGAYLTQ